MGAVRLTVWCGAVHPSQCWMSLPGASRVMHLCIYAALLCVLIQPSEKSFNRVSGGLIAVCRVGTLSLAAAAAVTLFVVQRRRRCADSPTARVAFERSLPGPAASLEVGDARPRSAHSMTGSSGSSMMALLQRLRAGFVHALDGLLPQEASAAGNGKCRGGLPSSQGLSGAMGGADGSRGLTMSGVGGTTGRATRAGGAVATHQVCR